MMNRNNSSKTLCSAVVLICILVLTACGSNPQAPVVEQGEQQRISAPIIVDGNTPDSSFRTSSSRPATVSSSSRASGSSVNSAQTVSSSQSSHRVRPGETLFSIAFLHDLDFRSLAIANGLNPPYTIFVDQVLNLTLSGAGSDQGRGSVANPRLGNVVGNSAVARSTASNTGAGRVLRQPVNSSSAANPVWQWPYQGRLLRGFQSGVSKGLDIGGNRGDAVLAAGDGDVVYAGRDIQGTGELIIIRHNDRYLSAYAHNSKMLVNEGARVQAGDKIAEVGESPSGIAMLHFEIREDGTSIDPARLLPAR